MLRSAVMYLWLHVILFYSAKPDQIAANEDQSIPGINNRTPASIEIEISSSPPTNTDKTMSPAVDVTLNIISEDTGGDDFNNVQLIADHLKNASDSLDYAKELVQAVDSTLEEVLIKEVEVDIANASRSVDDASDKIDQVLSNFTGTQKGEPLNVDGDDPEDRKSLGYEYAAGLFDAIRSKTSGVFGCLFGGGTAEETNMLEKDEDAEKNGEAAEAGDGEFSRDDFGEMIHESSEI